MPHFTLQIAANNGPLLLVHFGVSQARRDALTSSNQPVPNWFRASALLDTGASCTCIDPSIIQALGLQSTGKTGMITPTGVPITVDQYDVSIAITATTGSTPFILETIPVIEATLLQPQGFHALIGRDILAKCIFIYNGDANFFTLAY